MYCFNMRECPPGCCIPSCLRYALSRWRSSTHQQHCLVVMQRLASIYCKKPRHRNPLRLFRSRLVKLQGKLSVQSASAHQCRGVPRTVGSAWIHRPASVFSHFRHLYPGACFTRDSVALPMRVKGKPYNDVCVLAMCDYLSL